MNYDGNYIQGCIESQGIYVIYEYLSWIGVELEKIKIGVDNGIVEYN